MALSRRMMMTIYIIFKKDHDGTHMGAAYRDLERATLACKTLNDMCVEEYTVHKNFVYMESEAELRESEGE
jgi:hypothetical protein